MVQNDLDLQVIVTYKLLQSLRALRASSALEEALANKSRAHFKTTLDKIILKTSFFIKKNNFAKNFLKMTSFEFTKFN